MYAKYSRQVDIQRQKLNEEGQNSQETIEEIKSNTVDQCNDEEKAQIEEKGSDQKEECAGTEEKAEEKVLNLDELWDKLCKAQPPECNSLLKQHMTQEMFDELKDKVTSLKGRLEDCIRSGCENTDSGVGLYAADPEAYNTFAALFDPVIKAYHKITELKHPNCDYGNIDNLGLENLDPKCEFIKSTRVRVGRSHDSFGFPPVATCEDRVEMEKRARNALSSLDGEHKGTYHPLTGMSTETQNKLTEDHFLFNDHDRFLRSAGGYKDWPTGRGIFFNDNKTFLVWVNEEDHLRLISMQQGGDLQEVYSRLVKGIKKLESSGLSFARDSRLGYLTFCPTNLGTTLRASVHIKIPKLSQTPDFKAFCDKLNIQARGIHGEHTESVGGVYDISNKRRLGLTEIEAIKEMYNGVKEVIKAEKELSGQ